MTGRGRKPFSMAWAASALGLIAEVAIQLGRAAVVGPVTILIALSSLMVLVRVPLAAPALVIAGHVLALIGLQ